MTSIWKIFFLQSVFIDISVRIYLIPCNPSHQVRSGLYLHTHDDPLMLKVMMTALNGVDEGVDGVDEG